MSEPFVLPAGLSLDLEEASLHIRHDGDIVLRQDLGRPLEVEAEGDLTVELPLTRGNLRAGGVLSISQDVDGGTLHGREVHLDQASIECRAISATERIVIGPAKLRVDVILAPHIEIDPAATGRVTVIESENERGPNKIKGGFTLQEYEELFGDPEAFLTERGVAPMGEAPTASVPFESPGKETASSRPEPARAPRDLAEVVLPAPEAEPEPEPEPEEDIDDPLSLSTDDLTPLQADLDTLHDRLSEAVDRITACYEGKEVPPVVLQLQEMVEERDYPRLREDITDVWNGLLGYHQQRGIRPHHQVTHAFNVIHGLLEPGA